MRMNVSSIIVMMSNEIGYHLQVGGSNLCGTSPSGLPASSNFFTREKSNLTRSVAYGWNGGAFRASA